MDRTVRAISTGDISQQLIVAGFSCFHGYRQPSCECKAKLSRQRASVHDQHEFVFPSHRGGALGRHNIFNRHMLPVIKVAGLKRISLYGLRHTFATLALNRGVDVKTLSMAISHASVAFTMDRYCKVLPAMKEAQVNAIENVLFE